MTKLQNCFQILVFSIVFSIVVCFPATAKACDTVETATLNSTCVVMDSPHNIRGVWFPVKQADLLRQSYLKIPELTLQIRKLESIVEIRKSEISDLRKTVVLQESSIGALNSSIQMHVKKVRVAQQEAEEAREALDAWYRSPLFLISVGTVLGVLSTVVVIHYTSN